MASIRPADLLVHLTDVGKGPQLHVTKFGGGLDTETPPWDVPTGRCSAASNYEIGVHGAYQDIQGYERFDGRPQPHDASYQVVYFSDQRDIDWAKLTPRINRQSVRFNDGGTTYAYGDILADLDSELGNLNAVLVSTPTDSNDAVSVILEGATLQVTDDGGSTWNDDTNGRTVQDVQSLRARNSKINAQITAEAADVWRGHIEPVPGFGSIRGLWMLDGVLYSVRDNAAQTAAVLHKATATGWDEVSVGVSIKTIKFNNGAKTSGSADEPIDITTVTQDGDAIDLGTATLTTWRGAWTNGDAEGMIEFTTATDELENDDATFAATNFVGSFDITSSMFDLLPSGRFETVVANFGDRDRVYGCDGKNKGFEFDGENWIEIITEQPTDTPSHVAVHANHLFLAFGRSLQISGVGDPHNHEAIGGASENSMPAEITALHIEPGDQGNAALSVFTTKRIGILYGTGSASWELVQYREEVGALSGTVQEIVQTIFFDEHGIRTLEAVQEYGNFSHATFSEHIQSHFNARLEKGKPIGSCYIRNKNQYRVFFGDGGAYYMTFRDSRPMGIMPITLPHAPFVILSAEDSGGVERIFFGAESGGHVYELERGTSFDGESIRAAIRLHTNYLGNRLQGITKHFKNVFGQIKGSGYAELNMAYIVGNEDDLLRSSGTFTTISKLNPAKWDAGQWDIGQWDDAGLGPAGLPLDGDGETITYTFLKDGNYMTPLAVYGVRTQYTFGKMKKHGPA